MATKKTVCENLTNNWPRNRHQGSGPVRISFEGTQSRTEQHFKKECDVNQILAKYQRTGAITHWTQREPTYGEIPFGSLQEAIQMVEQAQESFNALPSQVRKRFQNDPAQFLAFVQDPSNAEEMAELGLRAARSPVEKAIVDRATEGSPQPNNGE